MRRLAAALLVLLAAGATRGAPPDCESLLAARGHLVAAQRAKEPSPSQEARARAAWAKVPPECRTGIWYATAANLLRHPGASPEPLVAGELRFATAKEALAAGLAACAKDAELVAYVAYLARIAPAVGPPLPEGACARLEGGDGQLRAYVCGLEAFAAGRWVEARARLATIEARRFPDLAELRAVLTKQTGKKSRTPPPAELRCDPFCPAEAWRRP